MTRDILIENLFRLMACFTLLSVLMSTAAWITMRRFCLLGAMPWRGLLAARRRLIEKLYQHMAFPVF